MQDILDKVCEPQNWQVVYEEHKGNLFAKIGIKDLNLSDEWIWKSDCGTESNVEKQKGEASDAFKRAGVMWGIGRFLYSKDIIKIPSEKNKKGKFVPFENGKQVWNVTEYCNRVGNKKQPTPPKKKEKQVLTSDGFIYLTNKGTIKDIKKALIERKLTDVQDGALKILLKELQSVNDLPVVEPNSGEVM